jgi:epoxyqueuosine reductase
MTTYTIETEAEPPPAVAAAIAATGWAAGCDLCQEVCPWNKAPVWGDAALWGQPNRLHGEPAEALLLGAAQWRVRTRRTALRRVRDRHWRRNVGFALAGKPSALILQPSGNEDDCPLPTEG